MSLTPALLGAFSHPNARPLNQKALAAAAHVKPEKFSDFLREVQKLQTERLLVRLPNGDYTTPALAGLLVGKLSMNEKGFGFLIPHNAPEYTEDLFVPPGNAFPAFHNDIVLAEPRRNSRGREGRVEAQILRVLEAARTQIVGEVTRDSSGLYIKADDPRLPQTLALDHLSPQAPEGHKVVVNRVHWDKANEPPVVTIVEDLGLATDTGVDLLSIRHKYNLPENFTPEVIAEAEYAETLMTEEEIAKREDFRQLLTFTIDPDDAKDFDDAVSVRPAGEGKYEVFVHIADVSFFVRPGTLLDKEAAERGNSTYLVDRVIPMLPVNLSNGLCSLRPNEDRLVRTVALIVDETGHVHRHRLYSGVIHSAKRFSYAEALREIQHPKDTPLNHAVQTLNRLAKAMRKRRFDNGSLNLEFPELKMRLDANGIPLRLDVVEHDESHQLIEECMLAANEACALETKNRQTASVYRVHEKPNPEKLEEYAHFAKTMGFKPGDLTKRGAIQKLLTDAEHTPHSKAMRYNLLRSLMRATYSPEPRGHFGLSKTNYTHFTSPIRRYADLLVHRALFSHKAADRFFSPEKLKVLCRHISDQERNSSDAETESVKLKKLQYLQIGASQTPPRLWQANIVEVEATGLRLDLPEVDLPASLPGRSLEKMGYRLDFRSNEFHARGGLPNLASGLALQVEVDAIDFGRFRLTVKLPGSASTLPQEPRREFSRGPARTHKKPEVSHRAHKKAKQGDKGKRRRR